MNQEKTECINWMNYEAIRKTVAEYDKTWGSGDDIDYDLSDFNITRNCMECNMRPNFPPKLETIIQIVELFKDPIMKKLEAVGMIRKCYKGK